MNELDNTMYFETKLDTLQKAKALRKNMTNDEKLLWERLKKKQILKLRFRRQHPIDIFISDFYCHSARLVVEEIHQMQKEHDEGRTVEMEQFDIESIRFSNKEFENDIENIVKKIELTIKKDLKVPPPRVFPIDMSVHRGER